MMGLLEEILKFRKGGDSRVDDFKRYLNDTDAEKINAELVKTASFKQHVQFLAFKPAVLYVAADILGDVLFIALINKASKAAVQKAMKITHGILGQEIALHMVVQRLSSESLEALIKKVGLEVINQVLIWKDYQERNPLYYAAYQNNNNFNLLAENSIPDQLGEALMDGYVSALHHALCHQVLKVLFDLFLKVPLRIILKRSDGDRLIDLAKENKDKSVLPLFNFFEIYVYLVKRRADNTNIDYQKRIYATWIILDLMKKKHDLPSIIKISAENYLMKAGLFNQHYNILRFNLLSESEDNNNFLECYELFKGFLKGKSELSADSISANEKSVLQELLGESAPYPDAFYVSSSIVSQGTIFGGNNGLNSEPEKEEDFEGAIKLQG